ncbi:hypothetical protein, variant [Aphanomyces invadans]|uniref:Uncharacterized protein n=1 Tax=Aphanomyces invadans TaxID=157072 RepID=A0A024TS68_9STRA|nr:hypothetical protein, variant [Aphanomyces invadans]ETV96202.1 hypothetical protein, variant [Aphanomyces invadans]|eukprot:XP_008874994.1 hypothetical protein, variant [Aphanomyces invadans]
MTRINRCVCIDVALVRIDTPAAMRLVSTLFHDHPDLLVGFNTFLPPNQHIQPKPLARSTSAHAQTPAADSMSAHPTTNQGHVYLEQVSSMEAACLIRRMLSCMRSRSSKHSPTNQTVSSSSSRLSRSSKPSESTRGTPCAAWPHSSRATPVYSTGFAHFCRRDIRFLPISLHCIKSNPHLPNKVDMPSVQCRNFDNLFIY